MPQLINPTNDQLRAAYDECFRNDLLRDSSSFYLWALNKLQPVSGHVLLDVACGSGGLLKHSLDAGLITIGLDFSSQALARSRQNAPAVPLLLADGHNLPLPSGSVDYLANLGSLEHFVAPEQGVREMARVLKPGGQAVILLPNAFYAADLVWWVWRKGRASSHKQPLERFAAFNDWRDLLEDNGLKLQHAFKYNFVFPKNKADWAWYKANPRKLLYWAASQAIPFNFSYSFLYVCGKA
jgi:SAM-dependent methyltransferase